jgi:hypothetical protein
MTRQLPPTSFLGAARSKSSRMKDHGSLVMKTIHPSRLGIDRLGAPWLSLFYAEVGTTPSIHLAPEAKQEACASRFSAPMESEREHMVTDYGKL